MYLNQFVGRHCNTNLLKQHFKNDTQYLYVFLQIGNDELGQLTCLDISGKNVKALGDCFEDELELRVPFYSLATHLRIPMSHIRSSH